MRKPKSATELVGELQRHSKAGSIPGMARFGIDTTSALGVSMPDIRSIAKSVQKNHEVALELWDTGIHEARILASLVDEREKVTRDQMQAWAEDFNSWDLCDQVCGNLFDRTEPAFEMIGRWSIVEREFVKRAAFAMIAWQAVHLKKAPDDLFLEYLPLIESAADDERNFVRKAVNWALRQIGKRSASLYAPALDLARKLAASDNRTSRWIGSNAQRELESAKVRQNLGLA